MAAIAVVDDDAGARERLGSCISRFAGEHGLDVAVTGFADVSGLLRHDRAAWDAVFLDIGRAEADAIGAAHAVRKSYPSAIVVFVSESAQLTVEGREVDASDFIAKPADYPDVAMVMRRMMRRIGARRAKTVCLMSDGVLRLVPIGRISYVEAREDRHLTYHTADGDVTVRGALAQAEELLAEGDFIRCGRRHLVNVDEVTGFDGNMVHVGGHRVEVSPSKRREILRAVAVSMGGAL